MVEIAVHKVADDFNGTVNVEFLDRAVAQVTGNGSDAIALFDRKTRDGKIAAIIADEGDVGAVERSDERQAAGRGHGASQQRADGMRNRVMDVEKIERR